MELFRLRDSSTNYDSSVWDDDEKNVCFARPVNVWTAVLNMALTTASRDGSRLSSTDMSGKRPLLPSMNQISPPCAWPPNVLPLVTPAGNSFHCESSCTVLCSSPLSKLASLSFTMSFASLACLASLSLACLHVLQGSALKGYGHDLNPPGHLQPVGFHRPAEIVIDEYDDPYALTPQQFYDNYVAQYKPVVFRGAAKHFPAFREWTAERLTEKYGNMEMRVETRRDGASASIAFGDLGIGRDTLAHFLKLKESSDLYVVSELPTPMYPDIEILPCMSCGNMRSKISEVNIWMSAGGSRSRLHRDAFNAMNCQINGTKDWIMVPSNQTKNVYFVASGEYEMGGLSPVNADAVDLKKYPRFRNVPWGITVVEAGDCIYVPGGKRGGGGGERGRGHRWVRVFLACHVMWAMG